MKNILFLIIVAFLLLEYSCYRTSDKKNQTKVFKLKADTIMSPQIVLVNTSERPAKFQIKLNSGFIRSEKEMAEEILNMPAAYPGESLERKAWRYVLQRVKFSKTISESNWPHTPTLLVNSIGNGICDDLSSTLCILWKQLGFKSRVWSLNGHVVPEVFANGRWQMYDPALQLYYLNLSGEIAGVQELALHPELITNPVVRDVLPGGNPIFNATGHLERLAHIYATDTDNTVNDFFVYDFKLPESAFLLPGRATLKFPVSIPEDNQPQCGTLGNNYSYLSIDVTAENNAELEVPLVLYKITGGGSVSIDGETFSIGSDSLQKRLNDFSVFRHHLVFTGKAVKATVYYLINKKVVDLSNENAIVLTGSNIFSVTAAITTSGAVEDTFQQLLNKTIAHKFEVFERLKQSGDIVTRNFFLSELILENINERTLLFINLGENNSLTAKSERFKILSEKLLTATQVLKTSKKKSRIIKSLSDPYLYIAFLTYLEHCDEQTVFQYLM